MSQVRFKSTYDGASVEVTAGWDRPLRHYHLCVCEDAEPAAEVVWSGLDHWPDGGAPTTEPLQRQLHIMGIEVPAGFWDRVELREGNVVYEHVDGEWVGHVV